ncbi:hypothetical protein K438DRAFT_1989892 [Mycena galopus ATCC 62051]|nr:hypothetical protein K438DRAFT_1989892 [Mycena galopus ATCC 62051]
MSSFLPPWPFHGHYAYKGQLYTAHSGSPAMVLNTPTPMEAPVIASDVLIPHFLETQYFSYKFPYPMFIPKHYPWHVPLFQLFDRIRRKLPIISQGDEGFGLHPDVADVWMDLENCLRTVGRGMFALAPPQHWLKHVNPRFFPSRFKFMSRYRTENAARFAVWRSIENFLPLLGYVSMGLWIMQASEQDNRARGVEPMDWRFIITAKTGIHPLFLDYVERSVNWRDEPEISLFNVPTALHYFVPDVRELGSLNSSTGGMRFSRWAINGTTGQWTPDPFVSPLTSVAAALSTSETLAPTAPFPVLPANSRQWKDETIQAFFIRRNQGNAKKMEKETTADRQQRMSRAEHTQKGLVPTKASIFVWENLDGHYIRQPQVQAEFKSLWDDYPGPQHRFDLIHNEWDLCELFARNDPVFGQGFTQAPDSDHDNDDDNDDDDVGARFPNPDYINMDVVMDVVQEPPPSLASEQQQPRPELEAHAHPDFHQDREVELPYNDVPEARDLGPDTEESEVSRCDLATASRNCVSSVFFKFGTTPRMEPPKYASVAESLLDIASQLASQQGLEAVVCTFFAQCLEARMVNDIDKHLLNFHNPQSMRNPAERTLYYELYAAGTGIGSAVLLLHRATDILEILRQGWGPDVKDVVGHLLARGILFFDDDNYDVGDCLWDETSRHAYWYDYLTPHEIDLLCGVYHVGTGQKRAGGEDTNQASIVSWWPKPAAWARRSLDGAWWTPQCENDFFTKRLGHFEKGVYKVQHSSEWKHNLKFRKDAKRCWNGYKVIADSIVQALIAVIKDLREAKLASAPPPLS